MSTSHIHSSCIISYIRIHADRFTRLRGYQYKTGPGSKVNPKAFGLLDSTVEKYAESQSSLPTPDAGAEELQARGFAEKT